MPLCARQAQRRRVGPEGLTPLEKTLRNASALGLDPRRLEAAGTADDAIAEFQRFCLERRDEELKAAGTDARKRKKLDDDFTPRLELTLVGAKGALRRDVTLAVRYGDKSKTLRVKSLFSREREKLFARPKTACA